MNPDYSRSAGRILGGAEAMPQTEEAQRAISRAMTELASAIGDLQTAGRELARRIAPLIPGGSPFDRAEKQAASQIVGGVPSNIPQPVRSHHCEDLDSRIYQVREFTERLGEMVKGIDI